MSVALVTGASSGIGAAIAIAFADAGWEVMAAGRDESRLAEVADVSENISTWVGELAESEDCDELISDTIDEFGTIDCLVNCAGVIVRETVGETSDDDWRETMSINLDVPFMKGKIPSTENVAIGIWEELEPHVSKLKGQMHCVKILETENNTVEYYGER